MLIVYEDGCKVRLCSLHCALTELDANKKRKVASLLVADRNTKSLLNVEKAFWVAGGTKRGVMTRHPTWAFATKSAAEKFIASYGGAITGWNEVLTTTRGSN
jgi:copper chaperone NosL